MEILYENLLAFQWQDIVMILLGCVLMYMAIAKEMEPSLLLPMGLGTILVNIPGDRKSTRLNSSHTQKSRMPSSA